MLGGVLINPNFKEVIPLPPEPIIQQDDNSKNDREQNASKRMLENIRREHPHLKLIVVEDALYATGPACPRNPDTLLNSYNLLAMQNLRMLININFAVSFTHKTS